MTEVQLQRHLPNNVVPSVTERPPSVHHSSRWRPSCSFEYLLPGYCYQPKYHPFRFTWTSNESSSEDGLGPLLGTAHVPHPLPGTDTSPFAPPPTGNEYQHTPGVTASSEAISPLNTNRTAPLYSLRTPVPTPQVGLLSRRYHSSRDRVILRRWCYVCE